MTAGTGQLTADIAQADIAQYTTTLPSPTQEGLALATAGSTSTASNHQLTSSLEDPLSCSTQNPPVLQVHQPVLTGLLGPAA